MLVRRASRFSSVLAILCASPLWAAAGRPIGTNLDSLDYWNTELPFVDAFKTSGPWVSGTAETWDDGKKLDIDAHGWVRKLAPGQVANMVLYSDTNKFDGTLEYNELARLVERGDHRDMIELASGSGNAVITISATAFHGLDSWT